MSKELNIDLGETGLTVTANVYLLGVAKATGIACAEIGVTGKYSGDFSATPNVAGVYQVAFFNGAETVSSGGGQIDWDGTQEVVVSSRTKPADTQNADIVKVNGVTVGGTGVPGDTWGPV